LLAERALAALRPALDLEHGRNARDETERRAERAKKPAIEIADEDARDEQHADHRPEHGRGIEREQPERLDVAIERDLARREVVADGREEDAVLHVAAVAFELRRHF